MSYVVRTDYPSAGEVLDGYTDAILRDITRYYAILRDLTRSFAIYRDLARGPPACRLQE